MPKTKPPQPHSKVTRLPYWWYIGHFLILGLGFLLAIFNPQWLSWLSGLSNLIRTDAWARFVGIYLISIVITDLLIFSIMSGIARLLKLDQSIDIADLLSPAFVGLAEAIMYPASLLFSFPEFIGLWLAVKVAGQWVGWSGQVASAQDKTGSETVRRGRRRFNRFLVGNALSIILAVITYGVMNALVIYHP